jgi:hypothetical protein
MIATMLRLDVTRMSLEDARDDRTHHISQLEHSTMLDFEGWPEPTTSHVASGVYTVWRCDSSGCVVQWRSRPLRHADRAS